MEEKLDFFAKGRRRSALTTTTTFVDPPYFFSPFLPSCLFLSQRPQRVDENRARQAPPNNFKRSQREAPELAKAPPLYFPALDSPSLVLARRGPHSQVVDQREARGGRDQEAGKGRARRGVVHSLLFERAFWVNESEVRREREKERKG